MSSTLARSTPTRSPRRRGPRRHGCQRWGERCFGWHRNRGGASAPTDRGLSGLGPGRQVGPREWLGPGSAPELPKGSRSSCRSTTTCSPAAPVRTRAPPSCASPTTTARTTTCAPRFSRHRSSCRVGPASPTAVQPRRRDGRQRRAVRTGVETATCSISLCGAEPVGPTQSCTRPVSQPMVVRAVAGHMHLLGQAISVVADKQPNEKTLLDITNWDFDNQGRSFLAPPLG